MDQVNAYLVSWSNQSPNNAEETWGVFTFKRLDNNKRFKAVGVLQNDLIREGVRMRLEGNWEVDKYSRLANAWQLKITNHVVMRPSGREGMIAFLTTAPNIGKKLAKKIWDLWGEESAKKIITSPESLSDEGILPASQIEDAVDTLACGLKNAEWYMPLVNLFSGIGFPKKLPELVIKKKLGDPVAAIEKDPFILMEFEGVGFQKTDSLRAKIGLPTDFPPRLEAATMFVMGKYSSDTWKEYCVVASDLSEVLTWPIDRCRTILNNAVESGRFVVSHRDRHGGIWVAIRKHARYEADMVRSLVRLTTDSSIPWPDVTKTTLTPHQKEQLQIAFKNGPVSWVLGNAGGGKTYAAGTTMKLFQEGGYRVTACAPTGKAALRLKQALEGQGVKNITPTTVHRMLKAGKDSCGFRFAVDGESLFIDTDLLMIDEVSMLTNELAWRIFKAVRPGTRVLLTGDPNQLPPVGRGTLLRDWPEWCQLDNPDCTYGLLTEIQRYAGKAVEVASQICRGDLSWVENTPLPGEPWDLASNLQVKFCQSEREIQAGVIDFYDRVQGWGIVDKDGQVLDPVKDIQVIVPLNEHSPISRDEMNELLQYRLNPDGGGQHEFYREGDKIICVSNTFVKDPETKKEDIYLANGSLGRVVEAHKKRLVAEMDDYPGMHLVLPTGAGRGDFNLAYALTGHKMQGSQAPFTLTLLGDSGPTFRVVDRGWFYTSITRHQQLGVVFSNPKSIARAVNQVHINDRHSFVRDWLGTKLCKPSSQS